MKSMADRCYKCYKKWAQVRYKGSTSIELSMMMPVILLVIVAVVNAGFYYHDKNVIYGKVFELGAIAWQQERLPSGLDVVELEIHYQESVEGKLLLFPEVTCDVKEESSGISITVTGSKGIMSIKVYRDVPIHYGEQNIRLNQSITRS